MADRLKGKVAIVTGAGSIGPGWGNGKAVAALFAREGARIFAIDLNPAAVEETRAIVEAEGGEIAPYVCDVSDSAQVKAMVDSCLERFGRIDILHNNVGIMALGGPVDLEEAAWEKMLKVNLTSMYLTCKHVLPVMARQGAGAIVNIGSIAGIRWLGVPYVAYSMTKGAIVPFTRSVALEYAGQGIRANTILPGLMDTPMVREGLTGAYGKPGDVEELKRKRDAQCPMGRMGDAWDVAHAALFLASDEARYITGTELVVDGGLTAKCV